VFFCVFCAKTFLDENCIPSNLRLHTKLVPAVYSASPFTPENTVQNCRLGLKQFMVYRSDYCTCVIIGLIDSVIL
jgi:hypothetical protein